MSQIYTIQWNKFVELLLPIALRKKLTIIWLTCLVAPVRHLHQRFLAYRLDALYRVQHNSQIAYMEAVLNDEFDKYQRRIRIQLVTFKNQLYFYEPLEGKDVFFYNPEDHLPVYFYEDGQFSGDGVDFLVCVPPGLKPSLAVDKLAMLTKMRGLVDYYKLYSKNYEIIWVQVND